MIENVENLSPEDEAKGMEIIMKYWDLEQRINDLREDQFWCMVDVDNLGIVI